VELKGVNSASREAVEGVPGGTAPEVSEEDPVVRDDADAAGSPDAVDDVSVSVSRGGPEHAHPQQEVMWECEVCSFVISSTSADVVEQISKSHERFAHLSDDVRQAFGSAQAVEEASGWFVKMIAAGGPDGSDLDAQLTTQYQAALRYGYMYSKDMAVLYWTRDHVPEEFTEIMMDDDRWVAVIPPFFFDEPFEGDEDPSIPGLEARVAWQRSDGAWVLSGQ
jgi:hypothetical protein